MVFANKWGNWKFPVGHAINAGGSQRRQVASNEQPQETKVLLSHSLEVQKWINSPTGYITSIRYGIY
jgi:hypothetical protein